MVTSGNNLRIVVENYSTPFRNVDIFEKMLAVIAT